MPAEILRRCLIYVVPLCDNCHSIYECLISIILGNTLGEIYHSFVIGYWHKKVFCPVARVSILLGMLTCYIT